MQPLVKHVMQTLPNNCVSACLAMIMDIDIDIVTNEFHEDYSNNKITPSE